jgi:hypothetical protein
MDASGGVPAWAGAGDFVRLGAEGGRAVIGAPTRPGLPAARHAMMMVPFAAALAMMMPAVVAVPAAIIVPATIVVPAAVVMAAIVMPVVGHGGGHAGRGGDEAERDDDAFEQAHGLSFSGYGSVRAGRTSAVRVPMAGPAMAPGLIFARRCRGAGAIGLADIVGLRRILGDVVARILGLVGGDGVELIRLLGIDILGRALPAARREQQNRRQDRQTASHGHPLSLILPGSNARARGVGA